MPGREKSRLWPGRARWIFDRRQFTFGRFFGTEPAVKGVLKGHACGHAFREQAGGLLLKRSAGINEPLVRRAPTQARWRAPEDSSGYSSTLESAHSSLRATEHKHVGGYPLKLEGSYSSTLESAYSSRRAPTRCYLSAQSLQSAVTEIRNIPLSSFYQSLSLSDYSNRSGTLLSEQDNKMDF